VPTYFHGIEWVVLAEDAGDKAAKTDGSGGDRGVFRYPLMDRDSVRDTTNVENADTSESMEVTQVSTKATRSLPECKISRFSQNVIWQTACT
jgi:hypothetical protein